MRAKEISKLTMPYEQELIGNLWPLVKSIRIHIEESNIGIFDVNESPSGRLYQASDVCNFRFPCINPKCTCGIFELFDEVSDMVYNKVTKRKGVKKCTGNEKKCCNRRCLSKLEFEIEIEYSNVD